jgi:hypothetical protein
MLLRENQTLRMPTESEVQQLQRQLSLLLEVRLLGRKGPPTLLLLDLTPMLLHLQLHPRRVVVKDYIHLGRRRGRRSSYWLLLLLLRRLCLTRRLLEI